MTKKYHHEPHFSNLLHLLMTMVQAQAGMPILVAQGWQNDRQTLAKKLIYHLLSLKTLGAGSMFEVNGIKVPFVDHSSVKVLTRSVLENYIVFAFIYGDSDPEVGRFRHMTWRLGGLLDRQRQIAITDESKQKLADERKDVDALRLEIEAHPMYANHTKDARKALSKKGDWTAGKPWYALAECAGLHGHYFCNIYRYLCGYSHASYAAALQVGQAKSFADERAISDSMFFALNMVMAHFITVYARLFDAARQLLEQSPSKGTVELFAFQADDFEEIYGAAQPRQAKP